MATGEDNTARRAVARRHFRILLTADSSHGDSIGPVEDGPSLLVLTIGSRRARRGSDRGILPDDPRAAEDCA
jgi:hypothetical protein